jgi:hypothetical protein
VKDRTALDERLAQALARALIAAVRADEAEYRDMPAKEKNEDGQQAGVSPPPAAG